jgi:hypothetical protein
MLAYRRSGDETGLRKLVSKGKITDDAYQKLAAHLMVDGAFNVNSISVTAWQVILGSLRGHDTARRDRGGTKVSLDPASAGETPVNSSARLTCSRRAAPRWSAPTACAAAPRTSTCSISPPFRSEAC